MKRMEKQLTRVAVDAMGGDFAPHEVVVGAVEAVAGQPSVKVLLVGQKDRIEAEFAILRKDKDLSKALEKALASERFEIVPASEVLEMDEEPARGIRSKKDCSINVCMQLVKDGRADAMMSAGNSGAVAASAMFTLKRIDGVARPAIAMIVPTRIPNKPLVLLDSGANTDCHPEWLAQWAIMGSTYSKAVFHQKDPAVGLMSIGTEDCKGNELVHNTFPLLKNLKSINFKGNMEGHDVATGEIDVAVCDGFVGNVVLKTVESVAKAVGSWLKAELMKTVFRKFCAFLLKPAFKSLKRQMDPEVYGGAPLLGVNGTVFITHGSSTHKGIFHAVRVTAEAVRNGMTNEIAAAISAYEAEKTAAETKHAAEKLASTLS